MKLYHGSNKYIENELTPHKSFHYKPLVYATSDLFYALVRAGKFEPEKFLLKEDYDGEVFTLIELQKGALEDAFNTDGYIYVIDGKNFKITDDCMENEYISDVPCTIENVIHIKNVLNMMKFNSDHYHLIRYDTEEAEDYWKTVRGGREGYLQRRKERVERLNGFN